MDDLLNLLAAWPGARWLQGSGTAYLVVNAAHILGLGLLIGAIVPLDVAMLRHKPPAAAGTGAERQRVLLDVLPRAAAQGLVLALLTGVWLFSVRPHDYLGNAAFLAKLALLTLALLNVGWQHRGPAWAALRRGAPPTAGQRLRAAASLLLWGAVLLAGRWIGFV